MKSGSSTDDLMRRGVRWITCFACANGRRATGEGQWETCPECGGRGRVKLTACPLEGVGEDVWSALEAADWAKDPGFLPAAGGTLDQAASFLAACRAVWREQARVEAARTKR